jgi:hypothetical protein
MRLTREQSEKLLRERGIWITEACDKCGKLLGAVRWTRRGEPGEWCSAECRDGIAFSARKPVRATTVETLASVRRKRIGAQQAGRPRKHANNAGKQRSYRNRLQTVSALRNAPSELTENARVADAKNGSCVVGAIPRPQALETAVSRDLSFSHSPGNRSEMEGR